MALRRWIKEILELVMAREYSFAEKNAIVEAGNEFRSRYGISGIIWKLELSRWMSGKGFYAKTPNGARDSYYVFKRQLLKKRSQLIKDSCKKVENEKITELESMVSELVEKLAEEQAKFIRMGEYSRHVFGINEILIVLKMILGELGKHGVLLEGLCKELGVKETVEQAIEAEEDPSKKHLQL